jgi:CBS domain containing-hemolysin-like protein
LDIAVHNNYSVNLTLTIQILLLTILVLLFSELTPKVFASRHTILSVRLTVLPLYLFTIIFYPIAEAITEIIRLTFSKMKLDKSKTAITEKELSDLAELGHERGTLEEDEHEIITSFVQFKSVLVGEVMTPRVDIVAVSLDINFEDLIQTITKSGHSRFPAYKGSLDKIIGIIHAKDLLKFIKTQTFKKEETLNQLKREVIFVPERKKISEMLQEFQQKKMHIAIVVDEFGGTSGLITLEDVIEEIIGEIWDEHDQEESSIKIISENRFSVLGKVPISEINDVLGEALIPVSDDYDTAAGLIISHAGNIPKEGYTFRLNDYKFTVKEVLKKRIKKVEIEKVKSTRIS